MSTGDMVVQHFGTERRTRWQYLIIYIHQIANVIYHINLWAVNWFQDIFVMVNNQLQQQVHELFFIVIIWFICLVGALKLWICPRGIDVFPFYALIGSYANDIFWTPRCKHLKLIIMGHIIK